MDTCIEHLQYIEQHDIESDNSNPIMQHIINLQESSNFLLSQLNNNNSLTNHSLQSNTQQSIASSNKRSYCNTQDSSNINSEAINTVKTFLYDVPSAILQIIGDKPNSHLIMSYLLLLFIKSGIDICPTQIKETNSFYSCVELNHTINDVRNSIKGFLQSKSANFINDNIGYPNMYNDEILTNILNGILNDTAENAKMIELEFAVLCLSFLNNIHVVLIEYENGKLSRKVAYKGYDRFHLNFKNSQIRVATIVTYMKDGQRVYQMFSQMTTDYDPFGSYNTDHLINV